MSELDHGSQLLASQRQIGSYTGSVPVVAESGELVFMGRLKGSVAHLFEGGVIVPLSDDQHLVFPRGVTAVTREVDGDDQLVIIKAPDGEVTLRTTSDSERDAAEAVAASVSAE